jgi:hypothetical protein
VAVAIATIARFQIAVVALLLTIENAVAAVLIELAQLTWLGARVLGFYLTSARAPVSGNGIAVIAGLASLQFSITANGWPSADYAGLTGRRT